MITVCVMNWKFKYISVRLILSFMAIQVINLSIDSVDFEPIQSSHNSAFNFNYFNSLAEYVSESVMGYVNAFPEYQNESNQSKSQLSGKHISIKLFSTECLSVSVNIVDINSIYNIEEMDKYRYLFIEEINPPPPEV